MKRHKFKILSLAAVFALSMALACVSWVFAAAETTYTPSNIFSTSNASTNTDQGYIAYNLSDNANIYYRKNLALKWFAGADGAPSYFSTEFSFGDTYHFETFTMTMEANPFSSNKESKSSNALEFTVGDDGALDVSVNGADAIDVPAGEEEGVVDVAFTADADGAFTVSVNGTEAGEFTDIGRYYAAYASSSADTPMTPLTFNVQLAEGSTEQLFVLRSLNGQSLALNDSGSVLDDQAPVLVINSDIKLFVLGSELDFDYVTIDVLDTSVTTTRHYYAYDAENPRVGFDSEDEDAETTYQQMDSDKRFFESDFATLGTDGEGYLSVAFELTDGDNSAYYFVEWYAEAAALAEQGGYNYVRVVRPGSVSDKPTYTFNDTTAEDDAEGNPSTVGANDIAEYQALVTAASQVETEGEDGSITVSSIQVGTGAYFYIPSLRAYIDDETSGYTDMTFDLYWRTKSADTQSSTGLSYDELRIELTAEGTYEFRIVPVNYLGNAIEVADKNGNSVSTISSSNIWTVTNIPTFSFTVKYGGLTIEEPEEADDGYIDITYSFDSFEIISLSDSLTSPVTEYKLYYLVLNSEYQGQTISQADLRASLLSMEEDGTCTYGTWVEIVETDDEDEESDYAESWSASSLSFVPKTAGYFGVTVRAYDSGLSTSAKTQAVVANVSSRADTLPGETYWLQNNVLSVVFICIGGACLIGIIVLLLIKPKDKKAADAAGGSEEGKEESSDLAAKRKNRK